LLVKAYMQSLWGSSTYHKYFGQKICAIRLTMLEGISLAWRYPATDMHILCICNYTYALSYSNSRQMASPARHANSVWQLDWLYSLQVYGISSHIDNGQTVEVYPLMTNTLARKFSPSDQKVKADRFGAGLLSEWYAYAVQNTYTYCFELLQLFPQTIHADSLWQLEWLYRRIWYFS